MRRRPARRSRDFGRGTVVRCRRPEPRRAAEPDAPGGPRAEQCPFAIVLGCSDSRVPAEIVFDQGLGDLFVIRVAGNIVAPSQVGSVDSRPRGSRRRSWSCVGHGGCGAVVATFEEVRTRSSQSPNVRSTVDRNPPVRRDRAGRRSWSRRRLARQEAVRANVRTSTNHLRHGSASLESLSPTAGSSSWGRSTLSRRAWSTSSTAPSNDYRDVLRMLCEAARLQRVLTSLQFPPEYVAAVS